MDDILREFLLETHENLEQLDLDLVSLEKTPDEAELLARVFRTLHTVKGTSGFLGLTKLQSIAHYGENLLSRLRARELTFNAEIATALLQVIDAIRQIMAALEASQQEGSGDYTEIVQTLEHLIQGSKPQIAKTIAAPPPPKSAPILIKPQTTETSSPSPSASIVMTEPQEVSSAVTESNIRVDVGLLDKLMNLVGELVLARNQVLQMSAVADDRLSSTVHQLDRLTSELQAGVMKTRMQPIGQVLSKFPRIVRDLAIACGKKIRLELQGQETELDKSILEAIRDPLTHMVRNAVDHGIETPTEREARGKSAEGVILLRASHEGGKVIIELSDDGGGIDPLRVRDKAIAYGLISPDDAARMSANQLVDLIFLPGFSTADRVTQFSGRGVGMDVVRTNIGKIGGTVDLSSELGRGTSVRLKIPLTLAIIPALIVATGNDRFAIPQASLVELLRVEADRARSAIEQIHDAEVYRLRGELLPLVRLDQVLGLTGDRSNSDVSIVVLQAEDRVFGLIVDAVHDTEEIVVKPLQPQLKHIAVFSGATLMGDGSVALILDVMGLAQRSGLESRQFDRMKTQETQIADKALEEHGALLCCAIGDEQIAMPLARVKRLEELPCSMLERSAGRTVVQYRGEILRLVKVDRLLGLRKNNLRRPKQKRDQIQVVVVAREEQQVGLVVDRILDIVTGAHISRASSRRKGVLFTAVVQDRVTEVLDVDTVVERLAVARG